MLRGINTIHRKARVLPLFIVIFIFLIASFPYIHSIGHGFVGDDWDFIVNSKFIKDWRNIRIFFTADYLKLPPNEVDVQRPLMTLSLMLDYQIWGLEPAGYHITNVVFHALNSVTLFYLISAIIPGGLFAPTVAASIFALHPIQTEAVNAVSFREDLLVTLFCLLSIILFLKGMRSARKKMFFAVAITMYILALMSKEMAITLPMMLFLIHLTRERSFTPVIKEKWFYAGLLVVSLLFVGILSFLEYPLGKSIPGSFGIVRYALNLPTITGISCNYLRLFIFPINLSISHDFPRYKSFFQLDAGVCWIGILILIGSGFYCMIRKPVIGLFILWFFITIVPVSGIVPIMEPVAERYLYFPSIGPIVLFSIFLTGVWHRKRQTLPFLAMLLLTYSVLTIERSRLWRDDYLIWRDAARKATESAHVHTYLGIAAYREGKLDESILELKKAESLNPNSALLSIIYHNMGLAYEAKGMHGDARDAYSRALSLNPYDVKVYYSIAVARTKEGKYLDAIEAFKKILYINPADKTVHYEMGLLYDKLGDYQQAAKEYRDALDVEPINAGVNLGVIYAKNGDYSRAVHEFKKVIDLDPANVQAHLNLGMAYLFSGERTLAVDEFKKVLESDPKNPVAQNYLGTIRQ